MRFEGGCDEARVWAWACDLWLVAWAYGLGLRRVARVGAQGSGLSWRIALDGGALCGVKHCEGE